MNELSIKKALLNDLDALKNLADSHRHELGFVRRSTLEGAIQRGEVLIAKNSSHTVGFAEFRHRMDLQTTLYHLAVDKSYRSKGVGRKLIDALREDSAALGKRFILLKCPEDLPANVFYKKLGFQRTGIETGKRRRLITWVFNI